MAIAAYYEELSPSHLAELVEGSITKEEKKRAELLEALLRFDLLRDAQSTKDELSEKVKKLIAANPISTSIVGKDDFRDVFDSLVDYYGEGSDFDLDEDVYDELYEDMVFDDDPVYLGNNRFGVPVT